MIFETHAHYDSRRYDEDREELLASLQARGVGTVVEVSADLGGCRNTMEMIEKYDFMYGTIGIHPDDVGDLDEESMAWMASLLAHPKIIGVGEIGLDYYGDDITDKDVQQYWMRRQIAMAKEAGLPIVFHSRDAAEDTLRIIREEGAAETGGVMHCFSYSPEMAKIYIDMGMYIGVGGVVTFKNGKKLKEVVRQIPLSRILLETDCPYMAPEPYRGKRNQSDYLHQVAAVIADLKGVDKDEVVAVTEENARRMFGLL